MFHGFGPILETAVDLEPFVSGGLSTDVRVLLIGTNGSLNQPATRVHLKPGMVTGRALPVAVLEGASCFTSLPTTGMFCLRPSESHKKRDPSPSPECASQPLPFYQGPLPAILPFSSFKPECAHAPLLAARVQRLTCSRQRCLCHASLPPPSRAVQPCCLPLTAKTLEADSISLHLQLSFTPACAGHSRVQQ